MWRKERNKCWNMCWRIWRLLHMYVLNSSYFNPALKYILQNNMMIIRIFLKILVKFLLLVTIGCGGRTNENNTYFTSQGSFENVPVLNQDCSATICKCDSSICQLRLDFLTFNLAGIMILAIYNGVKLIIFCCLIK